MKYEVNNQGLFVNMDSYEEFLAEVSQPGTPGNPENSKASNRERTQWTGTENFEEAMNLARNGWPEGLDKMTSIRNHLKTFQGEMQERHDFTWSESGDEADVGRFLEGDPENMIEFRPVYIPNSGRVVRIVVNIVASCGVNKEEMFRKGAAAVMLCDAIERAGLRCEIIMASYGVERGVHHFEVTLKRPDTHVELDRLAFALAHASSLRRHFFRLFERLPVELFRKFFGPWYSSPGEDSRPIPEDTVYIGGMHLNNFRTPEDTVRYINQIMDKYTEPQAV